MKNLSLLFCLFTLASQAQDLKTSDLPIIIIDTKGNNVRDEPKVEATIKIFWNGEGKTNDVSDSKPHFDGKIGIEFRGSSSQNWPKKPYGIELWDDKQAAIKAPLFGFPSESDWVLFASYNERSLMHNVLAQKIAKQMGLGGSRTQYCELVVNNTYQGVYVFMEKIKQGKGRVDIADMSTKDITGDALTGGYIIKVDKTTGTNTAGGWTSDFTNPESNLRTYYQYDYPKTITSEQRNYIRSYIKGFENLLVSGDFSANGYGKYIDMPSFAKFILVNEFSRNVDGYRISSFFYKDKDSKGGKLTAGPAWDFDLTFGNADYCDGWKTTGWSYNFNSVCPNDGFSVPMWWQRMLRDPEFIKVLSVEYKKIREGYLSDKGYNLAIDSLQNQISNAQVRNFTRWNRLGQYDWPIPRPIATTWQGEVNQLRSWLGDRLKWLDINMPQPLIIDPNATLATEEVAILATEVYPNPIIDRFFVKLQTPASQTVNLQLMSINGEMIGEIKTKTEIGENIVEVPAVLLDRMNDVSILRIQFQDKIIIKKLIKQ